MKEAKRQTLYIVAALILLPLLAVLGSEARAEVELELHGASYHRDRDAGYNESNSGVGITVKNNGVSYGAGGYKNSEYSQSYYAFVGAYKRFEYNIEAGAEVGVVTGYEVMDPAPFLLPYVQFGPAKIRLIPVPEPAITMSVSIPISP